MVNTALSSDTWDPSTALGMTLGDGLRRVQQLNNKKTVISNCSAAPQSVIPLRQLADEGDQHLNTKERIDIRTRINDLRFSKGKREDLTTA